MADNLSNYPNRVIFLALSGIGNFLIQSPTWQALKKSHPDWEIAVWVAPRHTKELAELDPTIDHVIEAPIKNSLRGHLRTLIKLRRGHYDVGVVLSPGQHFKSAAYLFLASIPRRLGHTYTLNNKPGSTFLLTNFITEDDNLHDVEQNLQLIKLLGLFNDQLPVTNYQLPITKTAPYNVISNDRTLIGFHPGSAITFLWKRWPLANFVAIGQKLINGYHAHILIFGGPDEKKLKEKLKASLGQHSTIIDADLLPTATLMQRCQFVLSNDSGLMHLAAASGTTTFGLFGPTNEVHTGPRGERSHIIRAPGTKPVYDTDKNYQLGGKPHPTMLAITPAQVLDKILRAGLR